MEIVRGDQNFTQTHTHTDTHTHRHTHTDTHTHTHRHTHTDTHTPAAYLISLFFFKKETRLKTALTIICQVAIFFKPVI